MHKTIITILAAAVAAVVAFAPATAATPKKTAKKTTKTTKPSPSELQAKAQTAFNDYLFEQARETAEELARLDATDMSANERFIDRCNLGLNMLQRVENIAIIDSLTVDADKFFEAYRLSLPSGRLISGSRIPEELVHKAPATTLDGKDAAMPAYVTENGEMIIWTSNDGGKHNKMMVTHQLADGSWEAPASLSESIDNMVRSDSDRLGFPFLMADGTTLYLAADNEQSLGGYDIFVTRDNGNGFLEPQNIGMPYNSPYNDYLLAIDEVTGAGWWATDRNQIPGKVTIYIFVPQELRINYPVDSPDLINRAKVTSIRGTGATTDNNARVIQAVNDLSNSTSQAGDDFVFALPGGRIITRFSQLSNRAAVEAMKQYLDGRFELDRSLERLDDLRQRYSDNPALREEIIKAEQDIERMRITLRRLSNNVVKANERK